MNEKEGPAAIYTTVASSAQDWKNLMPLNALNFCCLVFLTTVATSSLLNFPSRWVFQRPQLRSVPRTIGRASTMAPWTPTDKPWLRCWFIVLVDGLVNKKRWKLRFFMLKIDPNCHHPFWGLGVSLFGTVFRSCFSFWKVVNLKFLSLLVCRRVQVVLSFTF